MVRRLTPYFFASSVTGTFASSSPRSACFCSFVRRLNLRLGMCEVSNLEAVKYPSYISCHLHMPKNSLHRSGCFHAALGRCCLALCGSEQGPSGHAASCLWTQRLER